jgi:hypothetical protein
MDMLETVKLGATVSRIGEKAFYGCSNIKTLEIPGIESQEAIGASAFRWCNYLGNDTNLSTVEALTCAFIPEGITKNSLKRVTLTPMVSEIKNGMFSGCTSLSMVDFPDSITAIGTYALA